MHEALAAVVGPRATCTGFRVTFEVELSRQPNVPERDGLTGAWYFVFQAETASVVLDAVGLPVEVEVSGPRVSARRTANTVTDRGHAHFGRGTDRTGWGDFADLTKLPEAVRAAITAAQARFEALIPEVDPRA